MEKGLGWHVWQHPVVVGACAFLAAVQSSSTMKQRRGGASDRPSEEKLPRGRGRWQDQGGADSPIGLSISPGTEARKDRQDKEDKVVCLGYFRKQSVFQARLPAGLEQWRDKNSPETVEPTHTSKCASDKQQDGLPWARSKTTLRQ